jgi:hypothetical protein
MPKHKYVVPVPRPHAPRFEPDRPITDLVRNQLLHLSLAQRSLPKHHHAPVDVYSISTEGEASEYIRHVTAKLHLRAAGKLTPAKRSTRKPSKRSERKRAVTKKVGKHK